MSAKNTDGRTVVICGSMKNVDLMNKVGEVLESAGLSVITPEPDEPVDEWSVEVSKVVKREAARRHMSHIRNGATAAILVVNVDRPGGKTMWVPISSQRSVSLSPMTGVCSSCRACPTAMRTNWLRGE